MENMEFQSAHKSGVKASADEVDIRRLILSLWQGRWIIIISSVIFGALAIAWLSTKASIYRVDASLQPPTIHQLAYIQPTNLNNSLAAPYQLTPILQADVFDFSRIYLTANNLKKNFWENKKGVEINFSKTNTEVFSSFLAFSDSLKVIEKDESYELALMTEDRKAGVKLLAEFIDYANMVLRNQFLGQLMDGVEAKLNLLDKDSDFAYEQELTSVADRLIVLQEALKAAKLLSITDTPYDKISGIELKLLDGRMYLLGAKALEAEINLLEQRKKVTAFSPRLRQLELWKKQLEADFESFSQLKESYNIVRIAKPPEPTLSAVGPKRRLIVVLSVALGGMLGVFLVLIRQAIFK